MKFMNISRKSVGMMVLLIGLMISSIGLSTALAEKVAVPLGKSATVKVSGISKIKKIIAIKENVVEVVNVADTEIVLGGVGGTPDSTQLLIWDKDGNRVTVDVETYQENSIVQEKFKALYTDPGVELTMFPDSIYMRGIVDKPEKIKEAEEVLSRLVNKVPIVNLLQVRQAGSTVTIEKQIADLIKMPNVRITLIAQPQVTQPTAPAAGAASGTAAVAAAAAAGKVLLEGTVRNQNDYMRLEEIMKNTGLTYSNLVTMVDPYQVVFQAYILQVNKDNTKEIGIRWGGTDTFTGEIKQGVVNFVENMSQVNRGSSVGLVDSAPVGKTATPWLMNNMNRFDIIKAQVDALERKDLVKIVANPKLIVFPDVSKSGMGGSGWKKDQAAGTAQSEAKAEESLAYVKISQDENHTTITANAAALTTVTAVTALGIKDLFIEGDNLKFTVVAQQDQPIPNSDGPASLFKRTLSTTVRIKDGESVVLGGLIQNSDSVLADGVPGLSRLPLLGRFFRWKRTVKVENELVVILTPEIINKDKNMDARKKYETINIPRRSDRLEELHNIFQEIKQNNFPDGKKN